LIAVALVGISGAAGAAAATVPGPVTITSVTAGVQSASVAFSAPTDDGGSPVFAYTVTCMATGRPLTASRSGKVSPLRVGGMVFGIPYTCRVAARNRVGLGTFSPPSASVVPLVSVRRARPAPPTVVHAIPVFKGALIEFGGPPPPPRSRQQTEFRGKCTSTDGGIRGTRRVHHRALVVLGLTAGKTYTCRVQASNGNGFGLYSAASNPVVPGAHPLPPPAPAIREVFASLGQRLTVVFTRAPAFLGQEIRDYRATCRSSDGGTERSASAESPPIVLRGLSPAKTYTCQVVTHGEVSDSPPSKPSAPVVTLAM